jgi:hypothetical protein
MVVRIYRQGWRRLTNKNTPGRFKLHESAPSFGFAVLIPFAKLDHQEVGVVMPRD